MTDIYDDLNIFRTIQNTETDYDGPISEETKSQTRENLEHLLLTTYSSGVSGTITSDPPDDTTGILTDSAGTFYSSGVTLTQNFMFLDGATRGTLYTIDLVTSDTTVACAGDNLYQDGARSGDRYHVFYDLKTNYGHDHDGLNSRGSVDTINQAALKTSQGAVSTASTTNLTLPGGEYGFYPQFKGNFTNDAFAAGDIGATYITSIWLAAAAGTVYAQQRYVTSSGEVHWIYILKDKKTGETISMYEAPDHPCFGNGNRPELVQHPFSDYDSKLHEIIVINPSFDLVKEATARTIPTTDGKYLTSKLLKENKYEVDGTRPERSMIEVFNEDFEIIENKNTDWPDIPITVGLPKVLNGKIVNDYRFKEGALVTPLKRIIEKPDYIIPLKIKLK